MVNCWDETDIKPKALQSVPEMVPEAMPPAVKVIVTNPATPVLRRSQRMSKSPGKFHEFVKLWLSLLISELFRMIYGGTFGFIRKRLLVWFCLCMYVVLIVCTQPQSYRFFFYSMKMGGSYNFCHFQPMCYLISPCMYWIASMNKAAYLTINNHKRTESFF